MDDRRSPRPRSGLLTGWQAIADHFGRNQSTVRRWAETRALPIYRGAGDKGVSVYAYAHELDEWLKHGASSDHDASAVDTDPAPSGRPGDGGADQDEPEAAPLHFPTTVTGKGKQPQFVRWAAPILAVVATLGFFSVSQFGLVGRGLSGAMTLETLPDNVHALYRDAGYLWPKRTRETLLEAEGLLTRVTALAPEFADAHADLATVYNLMVEYHVKPAEEGYALSAAEAHRAIEIDPDQGSALTVLGDLSYYWQKSYDEAFRYFGRAVEADPLNAQTRQWYASALMTSGHLTEAELQIRRARDLNPDARSIVVSQAMIELGQGQTDIARATLTKLLENEASYRSPYRFLLFAELAENDFPAYLITMRDWFDLIDSPAGTVVAIAAEDGWKAGGKAAMLAAMATAVKRDDLRDSVEQYFRAHVLALAGDWRAAVDQLERTPTRQAFYYSIDPAFEDARRDPEFLEAIAGLGLPVVPLRPI